VLNAVSAKVLYSLAGEKRDDIKPGDGQTLMCLSEIDHPVIHFSSHICNYASYHMIRAWCTHRRTCGICRWKVAHREDVCVHCWAHCTTEWRCGKCDKQETRHDDHVDIPSWSRSMNWVRLEVWRWVGLAPVCNACCEKSVDVLYLTMPNQLVVMYTNILDGRRGHIRTFAIWYSISC